MSPWEKRQEMVNIDEFKSNIDEWIKDIRAEVDDVKCLHGVVRETADNTEYNYELLNELKEEIIDLKQELKMLKLMQIAVLESSAEQKSIKTTACNS